MMIYEEYIRITQKKKKKKNTLTVYENQNKKIICMRK